MEKRQKKWRRSPGISFKRKLSALGYKVFYDIESLSSGKFNAKLLEVIDECNDVLVILPPNSLERCVNEDDWLRLEVAYAIRQGKILFRS